MALKGLILIKEVRKLENKELIQQEQNNDTENLTQYKTEPDNTENKEHDTESLIQQAVDKATLKLKTDNKRLEEQLVKMKKEKLTDEERKQFELAEKEQQLEEREKALKENENKLYAVRALKKAGLDDGNEDSLEIIEFIIGEDKTVIDNRIKIFKALLDRKVKSEVEKIFKEKGREPDKTNVSLSVENPYKKETWNFTKQCELERMDSRLAEQLKKEAEIN